MYTCFPRLNVSVQVGNQLIFLVAHSRPEVSDAHIRLFGPPQVGLRDEHVAHGEHAQAAQLLWRVEDNGRKSRRHL